MRDFLSPDSPVELKGMWVFLIPTLNSSISLRIVIFWFHRFSSTRLNEMSRRAFRRRGRHIFYYYGALLMGFLAGGSEC
ncbi:hypothetical protein K402DRAFT_7294 [Aulographum hederae CBS 113979]|uniref:Uncharacterized protein n=1 Tax=Aulographum hederae CBS 113979 TaxID=1176131 RepID=A0A6G1HH48_9PEZI|nr:hypothetical protein K402DRAFT_7294 [Aulographum hederae CBS 113979]